MTPDQWALDPGEHVCWHVSSPEEYAYGRRALVAHAARTDGLLLVVGGARDSEPRSRSVTVLGPPLRYADGYSRSYRSRDGDGDGRSDGSRDGSRDRDDESVDDSGSYAESDSGATSESSADRAGRASGREGCGGSRSGSEPRRSELRQSALGQSEVYQPERRQSALGQSEVHQSELRQAALGESELRSRAVLRTVHKEVDMARRNGQVLKVLAGMEHLASPEAPLDELVRHELDLAELAASSGTSVVCAYSRQVWRPSLVQDLAVMHSRVVGIQPRMAGFRLTCASAEADTWSLEGSVGFESLRAFSAALRGALVRASHVRLQCAKLELIDAAGLQALIETVADTPGSSVVLDQANETVLAAWQMSGYAATGAAVEVRA